MVSILKTNGFYQILFCWAMKGTIIARHKGLVRWIGETYFKEWFLNQAEYYFRVVSRKFWQDEDLTLFRRFCDNKQRHFLIQVEKRKPEELLVTVKYICRAMAASGKRVLFAINNHRIISCHDNLVCIDNRTHQGELRRLAQCHFDMIFVFGVTSVSQFAFFKLVMPLIQMRNTMFVNFWLPGEKSSMYDTLLTLDPPLFEIAQEY